MGRAVIVAYRPKPGMQEQLASLVARHVELLRAEGLASAKPAYAMCAADGTIVEVFEWLSQDAIDRAHSSSKVQALWAEFSLVCDYVPVGSLAEASRPFSEFRSL
ncbi:MAG TPA: hypothetical protein VJ501_05660 [Burkholderiaceae bacterium]|nr:hypothetical protein [Burkholderiaceae bacterium]